LQGARRQDHGLEGSDYHLLLRHLRVGRFNRRSRLRVRMQQAQDFGNTMKQLNVITSVHKCTQKGGEGEEGGTSGTVPLKKTLKTWIIKMQKKHKNRGPPPRFSHNPKYATPHPQRNLKMTVYPCFGDSEKLLIITN